MAAENIDNTVNGTGLFPTKVPGLSDAADIQAALRLYHYGSYAYDGANVNPANLVNPSIAKHLQNLVDADATHSAKTTDVHGIANTANLATKAYVDTAVTNGINGATSAYSDLAGNGIDWNSVDLRFDLYPALANTGTVITKTESFTLSAEDVGKTILLSTSTPNTLTLPKNSSVQIPVGYSVDIIQIGTALTTITEEDSSVFLNSKSNVRSLDGQYSKGTLSKIGSDTWFFFGNLLNIVSPTPTPTAPTPTPPAPTPTPPAPTPTPPAPTPTPPAPTPTPPAPTPTPPAPTPTPTLPTLPTPTLTYTTGWNVYPSSVYANVTITNHDYSNSYSSSLGTQNPEFPEEFNISGLTPDQSYTVYITASRAGYQSSTGSITFAATPGASPTPTPVPTPTPTPTPGPIYITYAYCDSSGYINGYSGMDISYGGYTSVNEACTGIGNSLSQNGATNFTCVQGTASSPLYTSLGVSCINDPAPTPTPTPGTYNIYTYCDPVIVGSRGGAYGTATASSTVVVGTTTNPSLTSEQIVALLGYGGGCPSVPVVNPGTVYLAYCLDGQPYSESYTVDANNVLTTNINEACSVYTNLLSGIGATKIDCSIVSARPAPTGCSSTPTPTPPAPTPTAPTPTPPANCTLPNVVGMTESAAGNAIVASGWLFEYLDYTTVGATQQNNGTVASQSPAGGTTDICGLNAGITVYQYSQTPTPTAPTPTAPTPTAPTPTQTFYYAYGCCNGSPEVIDGPNSNTARAEYQSATGCTESGVTTNYQTAVANAQSLCGSTPTPTAPTPTAPTPTADCNTCNTYSPYADGSYGTRPNSGCPSGSEYYRTCVTPGGCPNIDQTNGCVPTTPTPTAPTPTAVTAQWKCTESYQCGGTGNCSYTTPGYDNPGSGSGWSRQCIYTTGDFPACQSTNCSPTPTAPTPTAPTPTADCNTCVSYGSACGTYGNGTWCITPGSCPNICQGDYAPTPTPPAPTPTPPASSNRTCSQSDYANLPSPYCMYPGACDPLGSLSSC